MDWDALAAMTHDMSGSDLHQIVNEAALMAVRECYEQNAASTGNNNGTTNDFTIVGSNNHYVTQQHLENAIQRHRQRSGQIQKNKTHNNSGS